MGDKSVLWHLNQLNKDIFTTRDISAISGKSPSNTTQGLNYLEREGAIFKVHRGLWAVKSARISPYMVSPYLIQMQRVYVSFISALHLYGMLEQIPQIITLATTAHTKVIRTRIGVYHFHQIHPSFFKGFIWYKGEDSFLIAEPEKALIDSLYLSTRRGKQFSYFPELAFPKTFSVAKARKWIRAIPEQKVRSSVKEKFKYLIEDKP